MADGTTPLAANRILNAQEVAMKLCESTNPGDAYELNQILNRSQIVSLVSSEGFLAYIGQSTNNIIPNNGELHRQFSMKRGTTKAAAAASTSYATYTFVVEEWDGLQVLDVINYNGVLYSNYASGIEAEEGYYYMTAEGKYLLIGEAGASEGGGYYTDVEFEEARYYACLSEGYTLGALEV